MRRPSPAHCRPSAAGSLALSVRTVLKIAALPIAASVLAACAGYGSQSGGAPYAPAGPVTVSNVNGVGPTLVDSSGKTVYYSDEESNGTLRCVSDCLSFWYPVPGTGEPAASQQVPGLGTMQRSDNGQQQLTFQGKPLYTFRLDNGPGQAMGNNFADDFGGMHFTWHAATTSGAPPGGPAPAQPPSTGGGGYGGYGY
jgi:predicted lipoprotein with Yx(FWY)xxD motif